MSKYRDSRDWQLRERGRKREWIDPSLAAEAEIQRERQEDQWDEVDDPKADEVEWVWDEKSELFLPREVVEGDED